MSTEVYIAFREDHNAWVRVGSAYSDIMEASKVLHLYAQEWWKSTSYVGRCDFALLDIFSDPVFDDRRVGIIPYDLNTGRFDMGSSEFKSLHDVTLGRAVVRSL